MQDLKITFKPTLRTETLRQTTVTLAAHACAEG